MDEYIIKETAYPLATRQEVVGELIRCKDCKHWKDSDGVYRRGIGAESKCPVNIRAVYEGNFYCADAERRTDG